MSKRMVQLLDERDLRVLTAVMNLLVTLVANSLESYWKCVRLYFYTFMFLVMIVLFYFIVS